MSPFDAPQKSDGSVVREPVAARALRDPFGRTITYLRLSVTDRCDLRCVYCMAEKMTFLPRKEVLTLEELDRLASAFIGLGVRKLRLTGGEPLVRKGFMSLVESLSRHLRSGALDELCLTTNGTRLGEFAADLARFGMRRINVSLDTLDADRFARISRGGDLGKVFAGLAAAKAAGLEVKINTVALAQDNRAEIPDLIKWAHGEGFGLTLIETMPLGDIDEDRTDQFVSLKAVREELESFWTLRPLDKSTLGPARYFHIAETGGELGLITPLSHTFCETCNRVRVTCTGTLHACLGQENAIDLREVMRTAPQDDAGLIAAIKRGIGEKPEKHEFTASQTRSVSRHMSRTGG
jgi:cyclic pyranopterin phosphate synthase